MFAVFVPVTPAFLDSNKKRISSLIDKALKDNVSHTPCKRFVMVICFHRSNANQAAADLINDGYDEVQVIKN